MTSYVVGVDIGTSSSKGVLVDLTGRVVATRTSEHQVSRPFPGHVEMDADVWWEEFVSLSRSLVDTLGPDDEVRAVGVSGMGPCVLLTDAAMRPVRPAMLYGVDMRATRQIASLTERYGAEAILARGGSALSTQAVGPKIQWVADNEPEVFARARHLLMPSSWLVWNLTGEYVLDQHSASQSSPLYDTDARDWYAPWAEDIAPNLTLPPLRWAGEVAGQVSPRAAEVTGLRAGIPVITGTVDAWSEAVSVDAHNVGDLMLMYGTTLFLVNTVAEKRTSPVLWSTVGALPDTRNLAAGMATSGAITGWLRDLFGNTDYAELTRQAEQSPPGANGLLMLPYFAGERTPIADPSARGVIAGLTVSHTRGDLYRAALEATAFGIRHNIEAFLDAGGQIDRMVAVGGGTQGDLWTQIVTDVTGRDQVIPTQTVGASYGAAFLAACQVPDIDPVPSINDWNPVSHILTPDAERHGRYSELFQRYLELYPATREIQHTLAAVQEADASGDPPAG